MSKKPLVSVIMPAYNAQEYIARAVESILSQTFKDFEFIIIDDASTDKTSKIIDKYRQLDKRIRIIHNKTHLLIAESLNKAISISKTEIIARMDADDVSLPNRLEIQYSFIEKNRNIAVLGANIIIVDKNDIAISKREYPAQSEDLKKIMFRYSPFAHPVVMFRKKCFLEFGGYNIKMVPCEDIDLWFKIGNKYKFASIPHALLRYRILPYSSNSKPKTLRQLELILFEIKIRAIQRYGYKPGLYDIVYNIAEFVSLWFIPTNFRVWTYNLLRSNNLI